MTGVLCARCGAEAATARSGKLVHVEGVPKGYAEHEVESTVTADSWRTDGYKAMGLKGAAQDMLAHHITGHPETDCAFAQNLRRVLLD